MPRWLPSRKERAEPSRTIQTKKLMVSSSVQAKENGVQQPFFLDFCTGEWKALSFYDYNTLALVIGSGNDIAAIQQRGKGYSLYNVSAGLEQSNYATKTRSNFPMPEPQFELPEGYTPEQFGDYPGVFMQGNEIILLSARKGNGKWVPIDKVGSRKGAVS